MMGKAVGVLIPALLVLVTATQWQDIRRYAGIRKLSMGRAGHPELVPVRGRIGYPQDSGHA